jgi:integrase
MARPATGGVIPPRGERRSWGIRLSARGCRHVVSLGRPEEGWNRQRAEDELAVVMRDVRRGVWVPPSAPAAPEVVEDPTFKEFAEEWFAEASQEWRPRTQKTCRWGLGHLYGFFGDHTLSQITVKEVDRYRRHKLRERAAIEREREEHLAMSTGELRRPLSNATINRTIGLLARILEVAVEYRHIESNPAKGRKRRLKAHKPTRSRLQREQIKALLDAADELDRQAPDDDDGRRLPLFATLVLAGLRISEALDLRWRNVHLAERKLCIGESKTDAGIREVDLTPMLKGLLLEYQSRARYNGADDLVFPTKKGKKDNPSNIRTRFLCRAVALANEQLAKEGQREIEGITPHSLRRTFVSLLFAAGADLPYAMAQAGHADPRMTLGVYAEMMSSTKDYGATLDGLLDAD